jgi:retron-type reverse transcriptase
MVFGTKTRSDAPSVRERPACGPGGARCIGGVSSSQALARKWRTCRLGTVGQSKWVMSGPLAARGRTPSGDYREGQSTARHRDGTACSSDEGPVMGPERRGRADKIDLTPTPLVGEEPMERSKLKVTSFDISKRLVFEAWEKVRDNHGAPGVDAISIAQFAAGETNNLYKLWNRMSAGSYMPSPVRAVEIPKDHGAAVRVLGVPSVADRIAQTAVAKLLEVKVEPIFHPDSYGYRPGRSAHDALAVCRQRCWKQDWALDLDVRAFFDSVPHDLLLKTVAHHTDLRWVLLYIERWLKAPMQMPDGTLVAREKGTPQGSPISPLLANLFMHYGFDIWMDREFPSCPFERYADDGAPRTQGGFDVEDRAV